MKNEKSWHKGLGYLLTAILMATVLSACSNTAQLQLPETERRLQNLAAQRSVEGEIATERYQENGLTVTDSSMEAGNVTLLVTDGGTGNYKYYAFTAHEAGVDASGQVQTDAYVTVETLDAQGNVLDTANASEAGADLGKLSKFLQLAVAKVTLKLTIYKLGKKAKGMKCGTLWYYAERYYRKSAKDIPWPVRKKACRAIGR